MSRKDNIKKRSSDLRRLIHYPQITVSGNFVRREGWSNKGPIWYVLNLLTNNVIGTVTFVEGTKLAIVEYRQSSWYADTLIEAVKGLTDIEEVLLKGREKLGGKSKFGRKITKETESARIRNNSIIAKSASIPTIKLTDIYLKENDGRDRLREITLRSHEARGEGVVV